jgi:hypothetical protein
MTDPQTIREHLEELEALHREVDQPPRCAWCETNWPCGHSLNLRAALDLTTEIENLIAAIRDAFDADYPSDPRANSIAALALLVPDPAPRGDADA